MKENRTACKAARGQVWKAATDDGSKPFMVAAVIENDAYGASVGYNGDAIFDTPDGDTQAVETELVKLPLYRLLEYMYVVPEFVINEWGQAINKIAVGEAEPRADIVVAAAQGSEICPDVSEKKVDSDAVLPKLDDEPDDTDKKPQTAGTRPLHPVTKQPIIWDKELDILREKAIAYRGRVTQEEAYRLARAVLGGPVHMAGPALNGSKVRLNWSHEAVYDATMIYEFYGSAVAKAIYGNKTGWQLPSRIAAWAERVHHSEDVARARNDLEAFKTALRDIKL